MTEELKQQQVDGEGAAPAGAGADPTSGAATTEATGAPNAEAQINAAVEAVIKEYEGEGGHLARLRSKLDSKIAELERQLRERDQATVQKAAKLMDSDPRRAAELLMAQAQAQTHAATQESAQRELVSWQKRLMSELGFDLDKDEEAAKLAAEWLPKMLQNQGMTHDFQQELAKQVHAREGTKRAAAEKELASLKEDLPNLIKAEVTRALADAGVTPAPEEGGTPANTNQTWRESPSVSRGIAERRQRPIKRT